VTPGYWQNPQATRDAFLEDGWIRTGDLATMDDEGFFYIVDRLKDMIISGGENVYPAEVEAAIYEHPGVAECAVVGVPHPKWGEVGRAVVVPKAGHTLTVDAIFEVLGKNLARYKIPQTVVFVDELPHNASGKLLRREVKDAFGAG
jgi:fatty-acyl-CoA synthase